jgi:glycosyltransferase involved in cell wall biosynthesis
MKPPLVSVIVPTKNSASTLEACLRSVREQTYKSLELIVVDNRSSDGTNALAKMFTTNVYIHGPERSAQRNLGATRASGAYLLFIDSDMELNSAVIAASVELALMKPTLAGIIIPETSFGSGFWSKCKALERSYYDGVDWIEAPRFMPIGTFRQVKGYDERIVGGEDWDLSKRLRALGAFGRVREHIRHNEGRLSLSFIMRKRFYYARGFSQYYRKGKAVPSTDALRMYGLFFSRPVQALKHPVRWTGMLLMKSLEFVASAVGYVFATQSKSRPSHG